MSQNSSGLSIPIPVAQGGTNATSAPAALTSLGALPIAGGTMTGALVLNADPVTALGAATKQYADAIAAGFSIKAACYASTTANLTATYANGAAGVGATLTNAGAMAAFSTDGVSPPINSRILVHFQTAQEENGIYTLTTVGSGAANWVLTRATDYDTPSEISVGSLVIVNNGTLYAVTSWIQTATVTTIGTDPIVFDQFTSGVGANRALSNLSAVAINSSLLPGTDNSIDIGDGTHRTRQMYSAGLTTGTTAADTLIISARDVDGASNTAFITLTANNTPTCVLASAVTGTTQAASDNSTKLATTAYVDAATGGGSGANTKLSNLASVAINTTLVSDTDVTDNLGTQAIRWNNIYSATIQSGDTAADTLQFGAWDVDGASFVPFITATANNTPTCVIASAVTGTTQSALDNSTKLATTAYVDAATGGGSGANTALSNLAAVAINTTLVSDTDVTDDLGTISKRWNNVYAQNISTDHTAGHTTILGAWDVDGASLTPFITLTANNTPTCALASAVIATTQATSDNSTKIATTAYADAAAAAMANVHLSNLSAVAINTSLLPGTDNSIDCGDGTHRFRQIYSAGLTTGTTAADTLILSARDVDGASNTAFITLTANNTPTCVIASAVTGTTQAAGDNSTKLATTAYADRMVPLAGGTMTGALILNADPTNALGAVTKQYADAISAGLDIKSPCYAATTANLNATYLNGASGVGATLVNAGALAAFSVDGVSPPVNSRILVKNQTSTFQNGIYFLTTVGSGAVAWVLTRSTDYDQAPSEIFPGNFIIVDNGTVNANTAWIQTATVTTIGTDPITFSQFAASVTFPITLAQGGTNANLTANNGGIFYSTASAGAILAGTATARQMLQSGASTTPAWSTATYPATTTINRLLYSSAANVISDLATANSGLLVTDGSGVPSIGTAIPNGVTATTQTNSDNSTKIATTAYVDTRVPIPMTVSLGGTGVTTLTTAYGVLCAGTTATGAVQTLSALGASGTVLTSNGAGALPSFQAASGGAAAATQAEMEAGSSTTVYSSPGRQQFHPSAAKAWVNANVNGTSDVSYNVSTVTDVGTGRIGISFTTSFSSADYAALCTPQIDFNATAANTHVGLQDTANLAAGRSDFACGAGSAAYNDPTEWNMVFFGDQ